MCIVLYCMHPTEPLYPPGIISITFFHVTNIAMSIARRLPDLEDGEHFTESSRLIPKKGREGGWGGSITTITLFIGWLCCSAGTVTYQKLLMKGAFPYPCCLNFMQTFTCCITVGSLYLIRPALFRSINKVYEMPKGMLLSVFVPIALCYTAWLVQERVF